MKKINHDNFEAFLFPKYAKIGVIDDVHTYIYRRNTPYPESYMGCGKIAISKNLGITRNEAIEFIIYFINQKIKELKKAKKSNKNEDLIEKLEKHIKHLRCDKERENLETKCKMCGTVFREKYASVKYCPKCR